MLLTPAANPLTAFGLSSSAGLNAYIPLLIVGALGHAGVIHISAPYDTVTQPWALAILSVLVIFEFLVDKVPGLDHLNDVLGTFIRPAAGALLFAMASGLVHHVHPGVLFAIGLIPALVVHGTKAATRPLAHVSTAGMGGPFLSATENVVSIVGTLLAIFHPIVFLLFAAVAIFCLFKLYRMVRRVLPKRIAVPPVIVAPPSFVPQRLPAAAGV